MAEHRFKLFADYHQLVLQDEAADTALQSVSTLWQPEAFERMLDVAPGAVYIGTARNRTVPLAVEVRDAAPADDTAGWDQVNECSISLPSGRLVVAGLTDEIAKAARIDVVPGCYRARVYYALDEDEEGDDHYRVVLWPAPEAEPRVLKQRRAGGPR